MRAQRAKESLNKSEGSAVSLSSLSSLGRYIRIDASAVFDRRLCAVELTTIKDRKGLICG